jgi:hypothetical protein
MKSNQDVEKYRKKRYSRYSLEKTELIGMEAIQDIIELVLWTLFVAGERIVSLLLGAEPESGKTELMKKYAHNLGIHVRRRFTAFGMIRDLREGKITLLFKNLKILGFIIVYDFINLLTFKPNTADSNIEFINAFNEDGLSKESAYWISGDDLKPYEDLKGGLIAGINSYGLFTSKRKVKANLYKGGFLSRNLVVTFSNPTAMNCKISNSISHGEYRCDKNFRRFIHLNFPSKRVHVFLPEKYAQDVRDLALDIAEEYNEDLGVHKIKGFRLQKSLISLAKASALRDGRKAVNYEDVERIQYLSQWMNLKMKKLKLRYPFA